jgi:formate hydrogenlyase subunit 3/multisubunit Na+/H+ antiporter MnhD subunit
MSALLPALILVPLLSAGVVALVGRGSSRASDAGANVGMIVTTALVLMVLGQALGGARLQWSAGGASPLGINLAADALSGLMLLVVAVGALAATVYSIGYMESYTSKAKYYVLFMLMVTGLNMVLLGADILNMYWAIEVAALSC